MKEYKKIFSIEQQKLTFSLKLYAFTMTALFSLPFPIILRHFCFVWLRLTPFIHLASFQYSTWYIDTLRLRTCCIFLQYIMFSTDSYCSFNPDTSKTFTFSFIVKHIGSFTGKEIIQYQIFSYFGVHFLPTSLVQFFLCFIFSFCCSSSSGI